MPLIYVPLQTYVLCLSFAYLSLYHILICVFSGSNEVPTMTLTSTMETCEKDSCSPTIPASNTGL